MKKFINLTFIVLSLLLTVGVCSCSKTEFNPEDYATSELSGSYGEKCIWDLNATVNGTTIENVGTVEFRSSDLKTADIKFIDVIPGDATKEFSNIPLVDSEEGTTFTIEYTKDNKLITIMGIVSLGEMTVDIRM